MSNNIKYGSRILDMGVLLEMSKRRLSTVWQILKFLRG